MSKIKLHVKKRDVSMKPNKIRNQGFVPANMYGLGESQAIQLDARSFQKDMLRIGDASLIYLNVDDSKKDIPVLIEEIMTEPVGNQPLHVTFRKVDMTEVVTTEIPIEMVGEVDLQNALVVQVRDEIEVTALPADLPENFQIDLSKVTELGQTLTTSDLEFDPEKLTIVGLDEETPELTIVTIKDEAAEAAAQEAAAEAQAEAVEEASEAEDEADQVEASAEENSEASTDPKPEAEASN